MFASFSIQLVLNTVITALWLMKIIFLLPFEFKTWGGGFFLFSPLSSEKKKKKQS